MPRILNIGSLNIDEVFRVRDFARPGETLSALEYAVFPGGKGCNQSIALARAGATISHAGKIGSDGRFLVELLRGAGAGTDSIIESSIPTGRAFIQVREDGQNCILLYGGANHAIGLDDIDAMLAPCAHGDWLLLQNEVSGTAHAMSEAARRGMRIILNPSPADGALSELPLDLVDCLVLNEIEAEALTGEALARAAEVVTGEGAMEDALDALGRRLPRAELVLTLGADGVAYRAPRDGARRDGGPSSEGRGTLRLPARRVAAVDSTAAGDTFTGYYIAARSRGEGAGAALAEAIDAAAICVTRKGAASSIPRREELALLASISRAG